MKNNIEIVEEKAVLEKKEKVKKIHSEKNNIEIVGKIYRKWKRNLDSRKKIWRVKINRSSVKNNRERGKK